jgi:hypothetical protein
MIMSQKSTNTNEEADPKSIEELLEQIEQRDVELACSS